MISAPSPRGSGKLRSVSAEGTTESRKAVIERRQALQERVKYLPKTLNHSRDLNLHVSTRGARATLPQSKCLQRFKLAEKNEGTYALINTFNASLTHRPTEIRLRNEARLSEYEKACEAAKDAAEGVTTIPKPNFEAYVKAGWVNDNCKEEYKALTPEEKDFYRDIINQLRTTMTTDTRKSVAQITRDQNQTNADLEQQVSLLLSMLYANRANITSADGGRVPSHGPILHLYLYSR